MIDSTGRREAWRVVAVALPAVGAGLVLGAPAWLLLAALAGLGLWHAWHAARLVRWLRAGAKRKQVPHLPAVWGDITTEIARRQERARDRRKRLTAMLERFQRSTEALPDATVVLGARYEIEWANTAARRLLGIDGVRDQGNRIQHLLRDPRFQSYLNAGGDDDAVDMTAPRHPDTELNVRVIPYGDGQHLLMARDVSNLRRLETVRRDFVANVSHELRTPLTVIKGYAESAADDDLPVHVAEALEAIERQTERMQAIVDDLLALSRMELDPVDVAAAETVAVADVLAARVGDAERLSGERGHVFRLEADADLGLLGASQEIASALANLINNAVQHTPGGTHIDVTWQADDAGGAVCTVADDGPGIDAEHLPRLTERFYRADPGRSRARGGTGLGLALVKHAVARNGGTLELESTPGEGSRFGCRFPAERVVRLAADSPASAQGGGA